MDSSECFQELEGQWNIQSIKNIKEISKLTGNYVTLNEVDEWGVLAQFFFIYSTHFLFRKEILTRDFTTTYKNVNALFG